MLIKRNLHHMSKQLPLFR